MEDDCWSTMPGCCVSSPDVFPARNLYFSLGGEKLCLSLLVQYTVVFSPQPLSPQLSVSGKRIKAVLPRWACGFKGQTKESFKHPNGAY